jgi:uncharacterized protein with ATP-grasp and redox domains
VQGSEFNLQYCQKERSETISETQTIVKKGRGNWECESSDSGLEARIQMFVLENQTKQNLRGLPRCGSTYL